MEKINISVIVPVYNMEQFIEEAIESIEKQTLSDIEIICIDDGSTDGSYYKLKKIEKKYSNIVVLQQKNSGSGVARNWGIEKARGEYVCFLDADDFYASNDVLEYLYNKAQEKNVVICGGSSCNYFDGVISTLGVRKESLFKEEKYISAEDYPGMTGYCGFIFQRAFIIENNIFFPEYFRGQDASFFVNAIACAGQVFCVNKTIYVYRKEHKKVVFDIDKALGLVKSCRDVMRISCMYNMRYVHYGTYNNLCGESGALAYKYSHEGSCEMRQLCKEINACVNVNLLKQVTNKKLEFDKKLLLEGEELENYILENLEEKNKILLSLKEKDVYIYGAGTLGKKVKTFLMKHEIGITAFLVSDRKQNAKEIDGIPVWEINDLETDNKDYIILIATFWYTQGEIIDLLEAKGMNHYYPIDLRRFYLWHDNIEH